jgi:Tol biopolymer transport system component
VEQGGESKGRGMARGRTPYLPALLVAAVLVACAAAIATLLAVSKEAEATFPGKNGRIAYQDSFVIYTINPDGSAKRRVTDTHSGGDPIGYSPDGKRITYTDYEGFNGKDTEIYTIKVGGGAKTKVTNNNRYDASSSYSPDGRRIVYEGSDGHDTEIYTIGVNGKNRVRLTNNATNDGFPVYSPDGKRIAAWSEKGQYIYTIGVHGGGKSKVVGGSDPSYSPDGKKIAYIRDRGRIPDIYAIDSSGGSKSRVTGSKYLYSNPSWGSRP